MLSGFKRAIGAVAVASILLAGCGGGGGGSKASSTSSTVGNSPSTGPSTVQVQGSASLSWTAPDSNTDGSVLRDLTGFVVLYGTSPSGLTSAIEINNPSIDRYIVENLTSGTWYFAVQAVNSAGIRSQLSGMASKTIT